MSLINASRRSCRHFRGSVRSGVKVINQSVSDQEICIMLFIYLRLNLIFSRSSTLNLKYNNQYKKCNVFKFMCDFLKLKDPFSVNNDVN